MPPPTPIKSNATQPAATRPEIGASFFDRRSMLDAVLAVVGRVEEEETAKVEPAGRLFFI